MALDGEMNLEKLNEWYKEAEEIDKSLFSEQKSNVLLVAGEHYSRKSSKYWGRIRDSKSLSSEQKLRITKNHIQKITKTYVNAILRHAPGTLIVPANDKELSDQKAAELNNSVWQYIKTTHKLDQKIASNAHDFVEIGEAALKIFYDPNAGKFLGYESELYRDESGEPILDEMGNYIPVTDAQGQMVSTGKPTFSGDLVFERIHGFNLLRSATAKTMEESSVLCYRKMVHIKDLVSSLSPELAEKYTKMGSDDKNTYTVFDASSGDYRQTKGMIMYREYYARPCVAYPNGYFWHATEYDVLFEGELPFGIFPICYVGFDEIQTTPRHRSIIKVARPFQAEINRTASKIAETQITLGDDKVYIQSGTKLAPGGTLPGVRGVSYTGVPPTVQPGRSGDQYLPYMESQIKEMYEACNVYEQDERIDGNVDPYALLFRGLRNKQRFSIYGVKFENFVIDVCRTALELKRHYCRPDELIPIIGKAEQVNIEEFKNSEPLSYQIKIEPADDDIHETMGKQLIMSQVIQYTSGQLTPEQIGVLIRQLPWGSKDSALAELTIDHDNATNDILALDRGQYRPARKYDKHEYVISRLTNRMKMSDYEYLHPQIQQMYEAKISEHEALEAKRQEQIMAAKAGFIPATGYLITLNNFYIPDPVDPSKSQRVRLPYDSIVWLIKRLEEQGSSLSAIEKMNAGVLDGMMKHLSGELEAEVGRAPLALPQ